MISRGKVLWHCELGGRGASVIHFGSTYPLWLVWKSPCLIIMLSRQPCLIKRGPLKENSDFFVLLVCVSGAGTETQTLHRIPAPAPDSSLSPNSQLRLIVETPVSEVHWTGRHKRYDEASWETTSCNRSSQISSSGKPGSKSLPGWQWV